MRARVKTLKRMSEINILMLSDIKSGGDSVFSGMTNFCYCIQGVAGTTPASFFFDEIIMPEQPFMNNI